MKDNNPLNTLEALGSNKSPNDKRDTGKKVFMVNNLLTNIKIVDNNSGK